MEQEEIALRVRCEHQETETTETIATETPDYAATPDTQEEHRGEESISVEEEPRVSPDEKQQQEDTSLELDAICDRILEIIKQKERVGLPSLKSCDRTKLKAEVGKVNEAVKRIQTRNITELNSLMYAAAYVTTERIHSSYVPSSHPDSSFSEKGVRPCSFQSHPAFTARRHPSSLWRSSSPKS